jgi:DNA repair protein RadC
LLGVDLGSLKNVEVKNNYYQNSRKVKSNVTTITEASFNLTAVDQNRIICLTLNKQNSLIKAAKAMKTTIIVLAIPAIEKVNILICNPMF